MNILVTGGTGNVGQGIVAHFLKQGYGVRVVDRVIKDPQPGAEYVECDITDFAAMREQVRGMDRIVHLAAYAHPAGTPGPEIFRVNCWGTYNVFEAAAQEGIKRVSCASSINALGYNFGVKSFPIQYFPIDEEHPTFTTDPYSFSKQTVESIAEYYWRRDGISSTCLRMPFVYTRGGWMLENGKEFVEMRKQAFEQFVLLPESEQRARASKMLAGLEEERQARAFEKPWDPNLEYKPDPDMFLFFGYTDFWAILSVDDTAQAFEKSLLADFEGSHPLYLTESENSAGLESETLLRIFYPEVSVRKSPIVGPGNMVSNAKAERLIGFAPQFLIRQMFE